MSTITFVFIERSCFKLEFSLNFSFYFWYDKNALIFGLVWMQQDLIWRIIHLALWFPLALMNWTKNLSTHFFSKWFFGLKFLLVYLAEAYLSFALALSEDYHSAPMIHDQFDFLWQVNFMKTTVFTLKQGAASYQRGRSVQGNDWRTQLARKDHGPFHQSHPQKTRWQSIFHYSTSIYYGWKSLWRYFSCNCFKKRIVGRYFHKCQIPECVLEDRMYYSFCLPSISN